MARQTAGRENGTTLFLAFVGLEPGFRRGTPPLRLHVHSERSRRNRCAPTRKSAWRGGGLGPGDLLAPTSARRVPFRLGAVRTVAVLRRARPAHGRGPPRRHLLRAPGADAGPVRPAGAVPA